jgi:hypothetical protein
MNENTWQSFFDLLKSGDEEALNIANTFINTGEEDFDRWENWIHNIKYIWVDFSFVHIKFEDNIHENKLLFYDEDVYSPIMALLRKRKIDEILKEDYQKVG